MADPFAAPVEPEAPATPPAPAITPEIEALIAQRVQELSDKRVGGLQSTFDKKLAEQDRKYREEIQRLRKAIPDFEDDEPEQDPELARRIQDLERQNALLRAAQQYPKATPLYEQLMQFETTEEQIAFLEERLGTPEQAPPPPPPAPTTDDVEVPDIDPNRPPIRDAPWAPGVQMTSEIATRILDSATEWPKLPL